MSPKTPITIFNTPILSGIFRVLAKIGMALSGWRIEGGLPDIPKYVLIGAPHTSNWDFILFLGLAFSLRVNARYLGKAELFRWPIGAFFRYCGGIPVNRKAPQGLVEQTTKAMQGSDKFILVITPEGTRHYVAEWKRGFYNIAKGAGIPIVLGKVDGKRKVVSIGEIFYPTDDMEADLKSIQDKFAGLIGIKARRKYIPLEP